MRIPIAFLLMFAVAACRPQESADSKPAGAAPQEAPQPAAQEAPAPAADVKASLVRINSTRQSWNPWQPWEKNPPDRRRALAAIVAPQRVVTTAELVADATYLELESAAGTRFVQAKVLAVDYEANLALLGPADEQAGADFFADTVPLELNSRPQLGAPLEIVQLEDNGRALLTAGTLQSVEVSANLLPGHNFLTYRIKASMQSAASSYSLPVLHGPRLCGVLLSYNSKDQICDVISTDILASFLTQTMSGQYAGFPSLGVTTARTEDTSFRKWLKLADSTGGIYIQKVRKGGSAEQAGVMPGDVLLAIDGHAIDRRGYYQHPDYGSLFWGHLIRGSKAAGEQVALSLLRDGQALELKATLVREDASDRLVPEHLFDQPPNYLIKGGLLFQELSLPLLQSFDKDWRTRAPLNLVDAYENQDAYEDRMDRVVILSGVIPTPATLGYERLRHLIVSKVNNREIRNMHSLIEAFDAKPGAIHSIEFPEENLTIQLDDLTATEVDAQLLQRGINRLSRAP